jgi:hypothetical protein
MSIVVLQNFLLVFTVGTMPPRAMRGSLVKHVPAQSLAQARTRLQTKMAAADISSSRPAVPKINTTAQITVGDSSKEGLRVAQYRKRTGEWKVEATGGRRSTFESAAGPVELWDHNAGNDGERLGRRKQQSNFFITINTNKRKFDEVTDTDAVKRALKRCFQEEVTNVLRFGPAHYLTYGDDWKYADAVIEKVDLRAGVERGPVTGALHAHLYLTISHWSQLQVDVKRLQVMFKETFNQYATVQIPKNGLPAVMIKLYPQTDWGQIMSHYLTKQMDTVVKKGF